MKSSLLCFSYNLLIVESHPVHQERAITHHPQVTILLLAKIKYVAWTAGRRCAECV